MYILIKLLLSNIKILHEVQTRAVISQGEPRDAAVHFDTYQILKRHRAVSLSQHAFLVGLCDLQTSVNYYLSNSDNY